MATAVVPGLHLHGLRQDTGVLPTGRQQDAGMLPEQAQTQQDQGQKQPRGLLGHLCTPNTALGRTRAAQAAQTARGGGGGREEAGWGHPGEAAGSL